MTDMTDTPDDESTAESDRTTIRTGRNFEEEYRLSADEVGAFLVDLGEQLQGSDDLRLVTDEWELPFAFGEPIELEVEYEGVDEPELEIEVEIPGRTEQTAPDVE
jgi:amphi-Trp domain-containing protein